VIERMRSLLKRSSLQLKPLDIGELLVETVTLVQSDARTRQVNISLHIQRKLPVVQGDRVHLQQVLLNLILNGMDAMADLPKAERLLIVLAEVTMDRNLEVVINDCGTGISTDNIGRLFEPFFTTKLKGMGMGLAISRTIIEAHGGTIQAENNAQRGATFKFTLPLQTNKT